MKKLCFISRPTNNKVNKTKAHEVCDYYSLIILNTHNQQRCQRLKENKQLYTKQLILNNKCHFIHIVTWFKQQNKKQNQINLHDKECIHILIPYNQFGCNQVTFRWHGIQFQIHTLLTHQHLMLFSFFFFFVLFWICKKTKKKHETSCAISHESIILPHFIVHLCVVVAVA